jgi:hypothetical protein
MNAKALFFTPVVLAVAVGACSSSSDKTYDELRREAIDRQRSYGERPSAPSTTGWDSGIPAPGAPINTIVTPIPGTGGAGGSTAIDGGAGTDGSAGVDGSAGIGGAGGGTGVDGSAGIGGAGGGTGGADSGTGGADAGPAAIDTSLSTYVTFSPYASTTIVPVTSDATASVTSSMSGPAVLRTNSTMAYLTFDYDSTSAMVSAFAVKFGNATTVKRITNSAVDYSGTMTIGMYTSSSACLSMPPGCHAFTVNVATVTSVGLSKYTPLDGVLVCGNSCLNPGCSTLDPSCAVADAGDDSSPE